MDEVYDEIFKLLEEKETLEQQLENLKTSKTLTADGSCSRDQEKLRLLSNVVESRRDEVASLKREVNDAKEKKEQAKQKGLECSADGRDGYSSDAVKDAVKFRGRYTFPVEVAERTRVDSPVVLEHLKNRKPFVITGSYLMEPAVNKWNVEYLSSNLVNETFQMIVTPNRQFRSYNQDNTGNYVFNPTYTVHHGTFETFLKTANALDNATNNSRIYFEQIMSNSSLFSNLQNDVSAFISWIKTELLHVTGWGDFQSLLSIKMHDTTIPAQYNTVDNLFGIVSGHQKFVLFSPSQYASLYPFPVHHPQDRQSQVNFDGPNFDMFPKFREAHGIQAVVSPGDIIYIPAFWWYHTETSEQGMTISVNFWFQPAWMKRQKLEQTRNEGKCSEQTKFVVPGDMQELWLQREVESLIADVVHPSKVKEILKTILNRRFDFLTFLEH